MRTIQRILVVDDDEDDFILAEAYLNGIYASDFDITWANSYTQAQELLSTTHFDLCLFDYMLGADTGLDLLMAVKNLRLRMPIIFLTGKVNPDLDRYLISQGVADYLEKAELDSKKLERSIRYALERTAALNALQESEEKYRGIFEASTDGICLLDTHGKIHVANASMAALLGMPLAQLDALHVGSWFVDPKHAAVFEAHLSEKQPLSDWEVEIKTALDETRHCILSVTPFGSMLAQQPMYQCVAHDITRRKKMEQEILRAEKIAATGRFMRMLGHEIRNPLNNIDLAAGQLNLADDQEETLYLREVILRNSNRINELLTDLLRSTDESQLLHVQPLPIKDLLDQVYALAEDRLMLHKVDFQRLAPQLESLLLNADVDKLSIALLNIVVNAIEVLPEGGVIQVRIADHPGKVSISVTDNGPGIPEAEIDRLFEPYFSKKDNGMGLGLASTLSIVKGHRGQVEVQSVVGVGTTFSLILPK